MHKKYVLTALNVLVTTIAVVVTVSAGPARPPGPPQDTYSYSLSDIYDRLDGKMSSKSAFTEPSSGPEISTGPGLDEIYQKIGERAPVPRTGQVKCWDANGNEINCTGTGQDGEYRKGATWPFPRFEDNGDGTATDKLTGLVWLKNANCEVFFSGDSVGSNLRNWDEALAAANSLANGYCGLTDGSSAGDWRLPNVRELASLIDYSHALPALPAGHPFTDIQTINWGYWSSSTCVEKTAADTGDYAWIVTFAHLGKILCELKTESVPNGYMLPVRDGE
ncbi:MAG: DUF1566 domain-containing protein [Anaerolineae bacterium]|nr:DUF1566 domain-containing protein [Anaerolineae bacterium]